MSAWSPQPYAPPTREQVEIALRPALPTVERAYPDFLRTPRNRWWKPIAAIVLAAVVWLIVQTILGLVAMGLDGKLAAMMAGDEVDPMDMTPPLFLANNIGLALGIPIVMLTQWLVWGQRPRWLSSVAGGFRWGWFFRCVAWCLPVLAAVVAIEYAIEPPEGVQWRDYTLLMLVGIVVTTPFQAAGEEYVMRGLQTRAVASWFSNRLVGWVVSTLIASATFAALHGAADPWLNLFYGLFGVLTSYVAWRTGGLESSVAIHVANNLSALSLVPFIDFSDMMDRSEGAGSPAILIHVAILAGLTAIIIWQARRRKVVTTSAPGREQVDEVLRTWTPPWQPGPPLA